MTVQETVQKTAQQTNLETRLRQVFKYINRFMVFMWRLGLGPWMSLWPEVFGQYVVITQTGRKTGKLRRTPVNYALIDGDVYCTAGFGSVSHWYQNLLTNPQVEVWLPDGWWTGVAEDMTDSPSKLAILREVMVCSGFAAWFAGMNPSTITDAELEQAARGYRLVRIRRTAARTGPGGPGDLAWVWPLATTVLLGLLLLSPRQRKCACGCKTRDCRCQTCDCKRLNPPDDK